MSKLLFLSNILHLVVVENIELNLILRLVVVLGARLFFYLSDVNDQLLFLEIVDGWLPFRLYAPFEID